MLVKKEIKAGWMCVRFYTVSCSWCGFKRLKIEVLLKDAFVMNWP